MKLVTTVMVRDEIDIVAAMIEHHVAQGADLVIATDNGSVDGTTEVLERYADLGVLELHHDPVHRKQHGAVVTQMARRAYTEHGADWVINADVDEFWIPVDRSLTVRKAMESIPVSLNAFTVPVTNLVGPPALNGSGIDRLLWRDCRTNEELQAIGIYAQPTDNAVHRGDPDIVVSQGNHVVSLQSAGQPDPAFALEVLHLPWRSWSQFEQKVVHAGRAYEANPDLRPSKNHHGMADYRRYLAGRLRYVWALRQALEEELVDGERTGQYVRDTWLRDHLHGLVGNALCSDLLHEALDSSHDVTVDPDEHRAAAVLGRQFVELERERDAALRQADEWTRRAQRIAKERDQARAEAPSISFRADIARVGRRLVSGAKRRLRHFTSARRGG